MLVTNANSLRDATEVRLACYSNTAGENRATSHSGVLRVSYPLFDLGIRSIESVPAINLPKTRSGDLQQKTRAVPRYEVLTRHTYDDALYWMEHGGKTDTEFILSRE